MSRNPTRARKSKVRRQVKIDSYATDLIATERRRQRRRWSLRHDDTHTNYELTENAIACLHAYRNRVSSFPPGSDPWDLAFKHQNDKQKLLTIAAALIQAEIERVHRRFAGLSVRVKKSNARKRKQ